MTLPAETEPTGVERTHERWSSLGMALAVPAALGLLAWLCWTGLVTRVEIRVASQRAVRVAELRGTIAYLDEWLTAAAQMAAATGDRRWVDRYDEGVPKLDAALAEATDLATPEVRAALGSTTGEARRDLATMERRALSLTMAGDRDGARALLAGPEYAYLQDVYATGVEVFGQDLKTLTDARASELDNRAWLEAAGLGLSIVLFVAAGVMISGRARLRGALARIAVAARTDALTGLPNRRRFYEQLEAARAEPGHSAGTHALLLVDLDRFKAANNAHGHPAGDELLQLVAGRLRALVRVADLVARLGGDEFAVVTHVDRTAHTRPVEPAAVAHRIVAVLGEPFALGSGAKVQIGASVGIAVMQPGDGVSDLMHRADVALYRAKADGRGCVRSFDPGTDAQVRSRALLEGDLRQAVADDRIVPYFQPLVELATGRLIGAEMLARWPHPTRGMIPPADFIPLAEDLGLIGPMTDRLLRHACRSAAEWPSALTLACNLSALQLRDPGLPAMIRAVMDEVPFPAERLELEVTESALVGDPALARRLLDDLKSLGVRLALDDFGTGYSSLRHLQLLPFDKLKIDASFVSAMVNDKESGKIVSAVVGLGQSLGLSTVAEGVETEETAGLLRALGCDIGQGWLFGRPLSAEDMRKLLSDHGGRPTLDLVA